MKHLIAMIAASALGACAGGGGSGGPLAPPPPVMPDPEPPWPLLALVTDCADPDVFPEGDAWAGAATAVIDGDSFCMGGIEVRLRRFSAPEWDEPGGPEATDALQELLSASPALTCTGAVRSYDRILGECTLADGRRVETALRAAIGPIREGGQ